MCSESIKLDHRIFLCCLAAACFCFFPCGCFAACRSGGASQGAVPVAAAPLMLRGAEADPPLPAVPVEASCRRAGVL